MATVFSTLYHAFCPLRSLKSFQLPFCCLGFIERKETHSPDLIWEEQSPPEAFFLFLHLSVFPLQNSSLLSASSLTLPGCCSAPPVSLHLYGTVRGKVLIWASSLDVVSGFWWGINPLAHPSS